LGELRWMMTKLVSQLTTSTAGASASKALASWAACSWSSCNLQRIEEDVGDEKERAKKAERQTKERKR